MFYEIGYVSVYTATDVLLPSLSSKFVWFINILHQIFLPLGVSYILVQQPDV